MDTPQHTHTHTQVCMLHFKPRCYSYAAMTHYISDKDGLQDDEIINEPLIVTQEDSITEVNVLTIFVSTFTLII